MISGDSERTWSAARAPLWDELQALVDRAGRNQRRLGADRLRGGAPPIARVLLGQGQAWFRYEECPPG